MIVSWILVVCFALLVLGIERNNLLRAEMIQKYETPQIRTRQGRAGKF